MMNQVPQAQPAPDQMPAEGQMQEPQAGQITGDPNLDMALASVMEAIPRNADQIMGQLLMALEPYLAPQPQQAAPGAQQVPMQGA